MLSNTPGTTSRSGHLRPLASIFSGTSTSSMMTPSTAKRKVSHTLINWSGMWISPETNCSARRPTVVSTMLAAMVTMSQRVKIKLRSVPPIMLGG